MLLLALLWLKLAAYGVAFGQCFPGLRRALPIRILAGLAIATTFTRCVHFFAPISFSTQVALDALVAGILIWRRKSILLEIREALSATPRPALPLLFAAAFAVLFVSSAQSTMQDCGLYYVQCTKWVNEQPATLGVGCLFNRLANNSSWFTTCALFNPGGKYPAFPTNGFLYFLALTFLIPRGFRVKPAGPSTDHSGIFCLLITAAALLSLPAWQLESPNTDVVVALIIWMLIAWFLTADASPAPALNASLPLPKGEGRGEGEGRAASSDVHNPASINLAALTCIAAWLPTLKLNTAPIFLLPLWLAWRALRQRDYRSIALVVLLPLLFVVPWLIHGVISSGYLVYPLYQVDLFNVDWKMPREWLIYESQIIKSWARVPAIEPATVLAMPFSEWFPMWLLNQSLINKALIVASLVGIPLYAGDLLRRRLQPGPNTRVALVACLAGIAFCLLTAPDLRFCYGFLFALLILIYREIGGRVLAWPWLSRCIVPALIIILLLHGIRASRAGAYLLPRHNYPRSTQTLTAEGVTIYTFPSRSEVAHSSTGNPDWDHWWRDSYRGKYEDRTWAADLPASPYLRAGLQPRGSRLADGYRIIPGKGPLPPRRAGD